MKNELIEKLSAKIGEDDFSKGKTITKGKFKFI